MRILFFWSTLVATILLVSCASPKDITYLQDIQTEVTDVIAFPSEIKVRSGDRISIIINSKDPLLADLFNLPIVAHRVGLSLNTSLSQNQQVSGYTIDTAGDIDFPILGKLHIAGMMREEIVSYVKKELIAKDLIKDPVVTVEFMNLSVAIMGEVRNPGRFNIDKDKITVLEAISMAGDLTIYGKRENVLVIRTEGDGQKAYKVDLRSSSELLSSPVYHLQQNDIVYVEPNTTRARQSTVNGNNVISTSFWLSVTSLLATIAILFVK